MKKLLFALLLSGLGQAAPPPLHWEKWEPAVFDRARRENKFVLLELEAVWCHWCHVMEETTYKDPAVLEKLHEHYIPVKVDQDSRPDLANRYEQYGWPATIVFSPQGQEIVCLEGYQNPRRMASILDGVVADPSPIVQLPSPPPPAQGGLSVELRRKAEFRHFDHYDPEVGGFGFQHKFLNWDSVEYALTRAREGDHRSARMAHQTLDGELNLVDPVWGGVYQYSTDRDWKHPHFEKIMEHQANNLRLFALAHRYFGEPRYREAADRIASYMLTFLRSPQGAFYVSQDADVIKGEHSAEYFALGDTERRRHGVPTVDRHCYARENGWAIEALALAGYREPALRAAEWVVYERALPGGGFRHDASDVAGPFLGDTLACGKGFLALHQVTGDPVWLTRAGAAADFIARNFVHPESAGAASAVVHSAFDRPTYHRDENIQLARFANLLYHHTHKEQHKQLRDQALGYLALPEIALEYNTGGVLLADWEATHEPVHFTLGGGSGKTMRQAVLEYPDLYRLITEEAQPDGALICIGDRCIGPLRTETDIRARLLALSKSYAR